MTDLDSIAQRLAVVFAEAFQIDAPSVDTDLVETGILDSFQLVELLFQLESEFAVRIEIENIDLDDLRTLERIARVIAAHRAATSHEARNGAQL